MTITLATTTITWQTGSETEPGEGRMFATLATGVRATIGRPSGNEQGQAGGGRETVDMVLNCDPVTGAAHTDRVTDNVTGLVYEVVWVQTRPGLGLDHLRAGLKRVDGVN